MPPPSTLPPPSRLTILHAGEDLTIRTLAGAEIAVRVGLVPLRYIGTFIDLYDKPSELAEYVCHVAGKPVETGWADQLSDEVIYTIHERATALNFQRAKDWASRQSSAVGALKPFYSTLMAPVKAMLVELLSDSLKSLPTLLSTPASPANNSSTNRSPGSSSSAAAPASPPPVAT